MSIRKPGKQPRAKQLHRVYPPVAGPDEITISVPEAGRRYFNLSRNGSYTAAARGDIPTIRIGKLRRVPVKVLEARLLAAR
jgi:hypothetical protein